ncbi:hypothetical protein B5F98_11345 [Pseudoflavonifractor sp. An44]|uniref:DUF6076 domain-containing protein n=1 Tax=Pseudoflavonifractor sp. An44 TaxID=1965635 RepID=UPI000B36C964|nr:DUF6076 domain-containing protein [Pseudoflavonifractor sp. An44]OUN92650.1 hypothetical protein B5F98_11345 [Pseudoflavonifractor sp. An44]
MWYSKMYFSEKREFFQFDASGTQGAPSTCREFPFLESLLTFQEMDCQKLTPPLERISHNWNRLIAEDDRQAGTEAMVELAQLGQRHIYLELLYVRWYDRFSRMGIYDDQGSAEDQQMLDELQHLPQQLPLYQNQIQRFFDLVLDVDSAGRNPQLQASQNYLYDAPKDPELFSFHPIPLSFEPVEPGRCSPVLYSSSISDMIDYSLRSCVERGITVRRCKNCGRYFPQTGRVSAEYCERPVAEGQQTCREAGAFQQWTKKQSDDPIFKAYRKEYKKRFAWIKAGRISDTDFYAWSEQAREMKKKCDGNAITLDEFVAWLKQS